MPRGLLQVRLPGNWADYGSFASSPEEEEQLTAPVNLNEWARGHLAEPTRAVIGAGVDTLKRAAKEAWDHPEDMYWNTQRGLLGGALRLAATPVDLLTSMAQAGRPAPGVEGAPSDALVEPVLGGSPLAKTAEFATQFLDPMKGATLAAGALPLIAGGGKAMRLTRGLLKGEELAGDAARVAREALPELRLTGAFAPAEMPVRGGVKDALRTMQRETLAPEELSLLSEYRKEFPAFREASQYMMPLELSSTLASRPNVEKVTRLMNVLPKAAEVAAVAKMGTPKLGWYRASTQALLDVFGEDAPRFSSLLAALSPQTSVENNLQNTLRTWQNWTAAGRPTDAASIRAIMGKSVMGSGTEDSVLEAWANNAIRSLSAKDPTRITLSGPKVNSFFRNLQDDVFAVTNDAWISNAMGVDQKLFAGGPTAIQLAAGNPGLKPGYIAASARQRQAGDLIGFLPSETQETYWSVAMPLMERAQTLGIHPRELLQRGMLTPEVIHGTPDFSSLLREKPYRGILEEAGYGAQLDALKPHPWSRQAPSLTADEQRLLDQTAARLGDLKQARGYESEAKVFPVGKPSEVWGHSAQEAIPYAKSGQLPGLLAAPYGQRKAFTERMMAPFFNKRGEDRMFNAAGFTTIKARPSTGLYEKEGQAREIQPSYSLGIRTPVGWNKEGEPYVPKQFLNKADYVNSFRGAMLGQGGVPLNVGVPLEKGPDMFVPLKSKVPEANMLTAAQNKEPDVVIADTGTGPLVFSYKQRPLDPPERVGLLSDLGGTTHRKAKVISRYSSYEDELDAAKNPPGSGAMTDALLAKRSWISNADRAKVDAEARDIATTLLKRRVSAVGKNPNQADVVQDNFLKAVAKGGIDEVAAARAAGVALPAALLALLPNYEDEKLGRNRVRGLLAYGDQ